jgi:hypothetical protein
VLAELSSYTGAVARLHRLISEARTAFPDGTVIEPTPEQLAAIETAALCVQSAAQAASAAVDYVRIARQAQGA